MPIMEKIETYSVYVAQTNYLGWDRVIQLELESGDTAYIGFPHVRPAQWLTFGQGYTDLLMTVDQYEDVYHLVQSESPAFFTALTLFGWEVGAVHTELDLSAGERPGEGDADPRSLPALIRRARNSPDDVRA